MSKFPKPPFKLSEGKEGDQILLDYLKESTNFKFLQRGSRDIIESLRSELDDEGLQSVRTTLIDLWPSILTDSLLILKMKDPREYDKKNPKMKSFFHSESLGTAELANVLQSFADFEGMLYGASPDRYRDHIVHSFRVWIIGQGLLKQSLRTRLSASEDDDLEKKLKISAIEWECMWAIVALCHDIGYPLSAIDKINKLARETFQKQGLVPEGDLRFAFSQQMLPFHDTIIKLMASKPVKCNRGKYLTHLQNKYYLKLLKSFDNLDHGIISSMLISKALVYFLESDLCHDTQKPLKTEDARQFLIRREMLRAIAAHTCQDIYHLSFNTLSFLLYIVDEMQCWGRPTLGELQNKPPKFGSSTVRVKKFQKNNIEIEILNDDKTWDKGQQNGVESQVGKLHRMLRLAVDTPKLAKEKLALSFKISNDGRQSCFLELKNGEIHMKPSF